MSITSAAVVNWVIWFLATTSACVKAASCPNDINSLYATPNGTVSVALNTFLANFTDYCNLETPTAVCNLGLSGSQDFSLASLLGGLNVDGFVNLTAYAEKKKSEYDSYRHVCKAENTTKFCKLSADVKGTGVAFALPFSLHQEIIGMPLCIPSSCDDGSLVAFANGMSPNITSLLSSIPGVKIDSFNVTKVTTAMCD
jgi:hypothetical protein